MVALGRLATLVALLGSVYAVVWGAGLVWAKEVKPKAKPVRQKEKKRKNSLGVEPPAPTAGFPVLPQAVAQNVRLGLGVAAAAATVATLALLGLLVTSDFRVEYVASYTSKALPLVYKLSAFWAGQAGSLLLWLWLLTVYGFLVSMSRRDESLAVRAAVLLAAVSVFFGLVTVAVTPPFATLAEPPADGNGLNPLLQNFGMAVHPVTLYLGYVGLAVPFAFALASLLAGRRTDEWIRRSRLWTLFSWLFLSIGILTGAQWAYVELGWGGYWGWDPVENASLLPWLTATAYLHSVMVQERRGSFRGWNFFLASLTFMLTVFGTFLTRSGVLSSVHAFPNTGLGLWFLAFMGVCLAAMFIALSQRPGVLSDESATSEKDIRVGILSREASILITNFLFLASTFAVFWGTLFPLISKAFGRGEVAVDAGFYNRANLPVWFLVMVLLSICPILAWKNTTGRDFLSRFRWPLAGAILAVAAGFAEGIRGALTSAVLAAAGLTLGSVISEMARAIAARRRSTGESLLTAAYGAATRDRRKFGGLTVHLAVALIAIGISGAALGTADQTANLAVGQSMQVGGYEITYNDLTMRDEPNQTVVVAALTVKQGGRVLGTLQPRKAFFENYEEPATEVAVMGSLARDIYAILGGWSEDKSATLRIIINPLMAFLWLGGYVLTAGALWAAWPPARRRAAGLGIKGLDLATPAQAQELMEASGRAASAAAMAADQAIEAAVGQLVGEGKGRGRTCPHCGARLMSPGQRFCHQCGKELA